MDNSFNPKTDRHESAIFISYENAPKEFKAMIFDTVERLQQELGRAPYMVEVAQTVGKEMGEGPPPIAHHCFI